MESGMSDNLRRVALTGSIPVGNRAEYQAAIIMRQPAMGILITDTGRVVKKAPAEKRDNFVII